MKKMWVLLIFSGIGCIGKPKTSVIRVSMVNNKHSVQITGLDNAILQDIGRDSARANWEGLVPVYKMPADTDLKNYQSVQPGTYLVKDGSVIFTPDTPFAAHQTYFIRYYKFDRTNNGADFISGGNRPGSLHYSDLIFK